MVLAAGKTLKVGKSVYNYIEGTDRKQFVPVELFKNAKTYILFD